jgi:hypothetical protein
VTYPHKLRIKEDRRKVVSAVTVPILVKDRNIHARIKPCLAYPSNFLTKFVFPGVRLEDVAFRGTQDRGTVMTNPVCGIITLSIKAIDELITGEYKVVEYDPK